MSDSKRSKRENGMDGCFTIRKVNPPKMSSVTLDYYIGDFREVAADLLKNYGKLSETEYQETLQGDIFAVKTLPDADCVPRVCFYAKEMLIQLSIVEQLSGLDSCRTELLHLAQLVNIAYFLGIGQYEDEIVKGSGNSNGTRKANKTKVQRANDIKDIAQRLADDIWTNFPLLNKEQVAEKILPKLPLKGNDEAYSVSHIAKRFIKKTK